MDGGEVGNPVVLTPARASGFEGEPWVSERACYAAVSPSDMNFSTVPTVPVEGSRPLTLHPAPSASVAGRPSRGHRTRELSGVQRRKGDKELERKGAARV